MIKKYKVYLSYPSQESIVVEASNEDIAEQMAIVKMGERYHRFKVDDCVEVTN